MPSGLMMCKGTDTSSQLSKECLSQTEALKAEEILLKINKYHSTFSFQIIPFYSWWQNQKYIKQLLEQNLLPNLNKDMNGFWSGF